MRPVKVIMKPVVAISTLFYALTFAWVVGINTTLSIFVTPLYNFGPVQIGAFYTTPLLATLLGLLVGHFLHDFIANHYVRNHKGIFEPESRLRVLYFSEPCLLAGLVLLGFALQQGYHWIVAAVGWFLFVFGILVTTVGIQAYVLSCYPEASGEVCAWLNFGRSTAGFIISYFQVRWANKVGTEASFGTQACICLFAFCFIPLMQWKGKAMRQWAGPLHFQTD